jgi:chitin synthase
MIIYMLAYPIYSLILPVYSFWKQDDFSWGQTRVVIGEKGTKQVVALSDEGFDPRSIPLMRWDDYAAANGLPGRRVDTIPEQLNTGYLQQNGFINNNQGFGGFGDEKHYPVANVAPYHDNDDGYEMDEMRSTYSTIRPASTILTGLRTPYAASMMNMQQNNHSSIYQPPISRPGSTVLNMMTPHDMQLQQQQLQMQMQQLQAQQQSRPASLMPNLNPNGNTLLNRQSTYSSLSLPMSGYSYPPAPTQQQAHADYSSTLTPPPANAIARQTSLSPYASQAQSPSRNPFNSTKSRPVSTFGGLSGAGVSASPFQPPQHQKPQIPQQSQQQIGRQPSNDEITSAIRSCLAIVDLDSVTKKELKTLVEGKLIQARGRGGAGALSEERRRWMDGAIDGELAGM